MDPDGESSLYYPSPSNAPSNAETTLSQRIIKTSMPKPAKKRVDKVTPKRGQRKNPWKLDRLEFAWNMERFTLNVDTRYNIIRLSPTLHRHSMRMIGYFSPKPESSMRTTMPETPAGSLTLMRRFINTLSFHARRCGRYRYTDKSPLRPIHLCDPPLEDFFNHYLYPYHDFPTIESHVHPRFIICNSGAKLVAATGLYETTNLKDDLVKVQVIWNSWMKAVLTKEFLEKTSDGADPDIEDDSSEKTTPRRAQLRRTFRQRKAAGGQDSPRAQEF
ncbi:hypothetical protein EDB84DRAFT_1582187 [Lactarius hengduanensis]|nr:hypothetical protein EDB84DRAFT_1582187 [Lactarius hengduanensis]